MYSDPTDESTTGGCHFVFHDMASSPIHTDRFSVVAVSTLVRIHKSTSANAYSSFRVYTARVGEELSGFTERGAGVEARRTAVTL